MGGSALEGSGGGLFRQLLVGTVGGLGNGWFSCQSGGTSVRCDKR